MIRFGRLVLFGLPFFVLGGGEAGAQDPSRFPSGTGGADFAARIASEPAAGSKSETTALLWSVLGTAVPAAAGSYDVYRAGSSDSKVPGAVLVGALLIGPSLGHFYAAHSGRALRGIGVRALAGTAGAAAYFYFNGIDDSAGSHSNPELGQALAAAGIVVVVASGVWDMVRAPDSVRRHNEEVRGRGRAVGVVPTLGADGAGIRFGVTF